MNDTETLVSRARNDRLTIDEQHAAFAELMRRFEEAAFGWSLQRLGDTEEAKDATQEAFLTAWQKLGQLRDAAAFGAWLKRLIATQCNRRLRKARVLEAPSEQSTQQAIEHRERQRLLATAMSRLSESEHRVVVLFYFLGRTLKEISTMLGMARGTVGKRLHSARIAIRKNLPRAVRDEFLLAPPSQPFLRQVEQGLFDEYLGEYRFAERPDLLVRIEREGSELVSYGGGQRSVLASIGENALITRAFDAEGRFRRDRAGRVVQFVYYEFGARLGVANKVMRLDSADRRRPGG